MKLMFLEVAAMLTVTYLLGAILGCGFRRSASIGAIHHSSTRR